MKILYPSQKLMMKTAPNLQVQVNISTDQSPNVQNNNVYLIYSNLNTYMEFQCQMKQDHQKNYLDD